MTKITSKAVKTPDGSAKGKNITRLKTNKTTTHKLTITNTTTRNKLTPQTPATTMTQQRLNRKGLNTNKQGTGGRGRRGSGDGRLRTG